MDYTPEFKDTLKTIPNNSEVFIYVLNKVNLSTHF